MARVASISLRLPADGDPVVSRIAEVFRRQVHERCGARVNDGGEAGLQITCEIARGIGPQGFRIEDEPGGGVRIAGGDARGLLYGAGKFLRCSRFEEETFVPGSWRGTERPEKDIRGIYFASHFHNYYHDAPVDDVVRYVEDLSLWGTNALHVWYDMHHYTGIDDPQAQRMIERLRAILQAGRRVGMDIGIGVLANEAYADSPEHLRAEKTGRAHYKRELCPHKPGAVELMLRWYREEFEAFADLALNHIWFWPYDQGGCGCEQCRPWGGNGMPLMTGKISELFKEIFPGGKTIFSTWLFNETDWDGLSKAFEEPAARTDYILADSQRGVPTYPLEHGVPGGLPLLSFPEISMWGAKPWGGYGANPQPARLQEIWDVYGPHLSGGFPYSEGLYEDVNKAIISQFHWKGAWSAAETIKEYVAYEFSPDVVDDVVKAFEIMEESYPRDLTIREDRLALERCDLRHASRVGECCDLIRAAEAKLPARASGAWRWQVIRIRSEIDAELVRHGGEVTEAVYDRMRELDDMCHTHMGTWEVRPPLPDSFTALLKIKRPEQIPREVRTRV